MVIFDHLFQFYHYRNLSDFYSPSHPVKIDLDKKLDPKQKTIQAFNIDA